MIAAALLLLFGTLLTAPSVLGWLLVAVNNPHPDDLALPRIGASLGRTLIAFGVVAVVLGHASLGGLALGAVVAVAVLATASVITLVPVPARPGPRF